MNANEIDRALRGDRTIAPSPEFASRVMGAVRRQVGEREALPFPWRRLVPGLLASAAVTIAALLFLPPPTIPESVASLLRDQAVAQSLTWVPVGIVGTWALIWSSMRLAGYRR